MKYPAELTWFNVACQVLDQKTLKMKQVSQQPLQNILTTFLKVPQAIEEQRNIVVIVVYTKMQSTEEAQRDILAAAWPCRSCQSCTGTADSCTLISALHMMLMAQLYLGAVSHWWKRLSRRVPGNSGAEWSWKVHLPGHPVPP